MSDDNKRPIIRRIKKIKKHGHHGGSWKIAYADFVTAMMAFFLLMWLLSLMNKYQLAGVAEYFKKPLKEAFAHEGIARNRDVNKDKNTEKEKWKEKPTVIDEKPKNDKELSNVSSVETPIQKTQSNVSSIKTPLKQMQSNVALTPTEQKQMQNNIETKTASSKEQQSQDLAKPNTSTAQDQQQQKDAIQEIKDELEHKMQTDPKLQQFKNQLNFEVTADGLKITLHDLENKSMFTNGKADFQNYAKNVLTVLSEELNQYPNQVIIIGHTDTRPFNGSRYGNWELSADRANSTRRALVEYGMTEDKILRVIGVADTDLLNKKDGEDPTNRRIEIIVLTDEAMKKLTGHH